jgi:hypothetical protein
MVSTKPMFIYATTKKEWVEFDITRLQAKKSPEKWIVTITGSKIHLRNIDSLDLGDPALRLVVANVQALPALCANAPGILKMLTGLFVHAGRGEQPRSADARTVLDEVWEKKKIALPDALKRRAVAVTTKGDPDFRVPALMQLRKWLSDPRCLGSDIPRALDQEISSLAEAHQHLLSREAIGQVSLQFVLAQGAWQELVKADKRRQFRQSLRDWLNSEAAQEVIALARIEVPAGALKQHLSEEANVKDAGDMPREASEFMTACRGFVSAHTPKAY